MKRENYPKSSGRHFHSLSVELPEHCVLERAQTFPAVIAWSLSFCRFQSILLDPQKKFLLISCIRRMSFSVTSYVGHCFIIHLPGGGHCPLVRDSEPIRLLVIPTSPNLYMLIYYIIHCVMLYLTIIPRSGGD